MFTLFDYLAEFVVVAEKGSISEAATVLSLSQPTISKHLGALETELGRSLIVRTPHGNELTPVGVAVYEAGKRLYDVGEEVERVVRQRRSLTVLQLVDSLGLYRRVFRAIKRFETADACDLRVRLEQERYFGSPAAALDAGVDLAVCFDGSCPELHRGDYRCVDLGNCAFSVVVTADNPLAGRAALGVAELIGQRFSRLTGGSSVLNHVWQTIRLGCAAAGVNPEFVTHKVFHPAEVPDITLGADEAFLVPADSQSVPNMEADPGMRCIPLTDFDQRVVVAYRTDNADAARFCATLVGEG